MSEQADIEAAMARATAAYKNVSAERDALKDAADRAAAAEAENETLRAEKEWLHEALLRERAENARLREAASEGLDILTNLHDSIAKHGNYSAEATMCFVDQAGACLREALAKEAGQ